MFLPQVEENKSIDQINHLLNQFEIQLKHLRLENTHNSIMVLGRIICEEMTQLLLKKEGKYDPEARNTFYNNIEILYQNKIIPKECRDFLNLIRIYANKTVHGIEISDKFVLSFLNAFNLFIQWFDSYYYQKYHKSFQIESCCNLMNSIEYDGLKHSIVFVKGKNNLNNTTSQVETFKTKKEMQILTQKINSKQNELKKEKQLKEQKKLINYNKKKSSNEKTKKEKQFQFDRKPRSKEYLLNIEIQRLREKLKQKEKIHNIEKNEILKKLDEQGKLFKRCLDLLEENNERGIRIESKIDELHSKIDNISNNISTIQSFCERQINNAQSNEEIERIISSFIEECIDNIMRHSANFKENENYQIEERKLINSIGEESWNKLCEKSKTFLITSKVMYNHLIIMDDIIDYSGICVLVTKALEVELHKRFFTEFLEYLDDKYNCKYEKYHTALLYNNRQPLYSEKFSMGDIAFVMCYKENWNDTNQQKSNNKLELMEYCKECVFSNYNEDEIKGLLKKYATSIEDIRITYRNPSAHTNEIKRIDAEECFNLVLDIEKLLKQMLDSFDK